jgi:hypothetical protein
MTRDQPAARWVVLLAALSLPSLAGAQDLEPRLYTNTPVGVNFVIVGYGYQTGDVLTDAALPISDAQVELHSAAIAYVRSFGLLGMSGKCDVVFPYGWVSGSATVAGRQRRREVEGFADPRFRVSVNLLGAPALSVAEFGDYQQDLILGVSLSMWAPIGQYDADRLLNLGVNRWAFKPEIGVSKALGRWSSRSRPPSSSSPKTPTSSVAGCASRRPSMRCRDTPSTGSARPCGWPSTRRTTGAARRRSTAWRTATASRTSASAGRSRCR